MDIECVTTAHRSTKLVDFLLGGENFGVPIELVKEIIRMPEITLLPKAPEHVRGVVNLRGEIIPILNLARNLGMERGAGDEPKVIVIEFAGVQIGLEVTDVHEVIDLDHTQISDPPPMVSTTNGSYIAGIGEVNGRLLIILELEQLIYDIGDSLSELVGGQENPNEN